MIIFYDLQTGALQGYIEGRVLHDHHLNMWHGEKEKVGRIVVQWKPVKFYDKDGNEIDPNTQEVFAADFEPQHEQKEIMIEIDENPSKLYDYHVDIEKLQLVRNNI